MILSSVRCRVACRNGARIASRLSKRSIRLKDVDIDMDSVTFTVSSRDYDRVVALIAEYGYSVEGVTNLGLLGLLKGSITVLPFTVTLILATMLCVIGSMYVYNVKVVDERGEPCYEVENFLKEEGFSGSMPKSQIDTDDIENMILSHMPSVSFATCHIEGLSLYVTVVGKDNLYEKVEKSSLTAVAEGVVTRIIVRSGTPQVSEGERVKIGDELIAGYHIADNTPTDGEENGERIECVADGEVYGIVYHHKRAVIPERIVYMQPTGNVKVQRDIYLGNWLIGRQHKIPYAHYQYTRTESVINNILPFRVVTHTYHEYYEVAMDRQSYIDKVVGDAQRGIIDNIPLGGRIIDINHTVKNIGGEEVIDIYVSVERRLDNGGQNY